MSIVRQTSALIPIQPLAMSDEDFSELSTTKFLPRVQIFGTSSKLVKQGKFPSGQYGLVTGKDKAQVLGPQFDCLPINVRPKAMDLRNKTPISVFDAKSEQFAAIKAVSMGKNTKCMCGPEFLLWLPNEYKFATMFFNNITMQSVAPEMKELIGYAVTCSIQFIPSEEYGGWHGPVITECSTPLSSLPSKAAINDQIELFLAKEPQIEVATDEEDQSSRPR